MLGLSDADKIHPIPALLPSCHLSSTGPPRLAIPQNPRVHQHLSSNRSFLSQNEWTRNCLILPFLFNSHSVTIYHPKICAITALSHRNLLEENGIILQKLRGFKILQQSSSPVHIQTPHLPKSERSDALNQCFPHTNILLENSETPFSWSYLPCKPRTKPKPLSQSLGAAKGHLQDTNPGWFGTNDKVSRLPEPVCPAGAPSPVSPGFLGCRGRVSRV